MCNQWCCLLCGYPTQPNEQYSAGPVCHSLPTRYLFQTKFLYYNLKKNIFEICDCLENWLISVSLNDEGFFYKRISVKYIFILTLFMCL